MNMNMNQYEKQFLSVTFCVNAYWLGEISTNLLCKKTKSNKLKNIDDRQHK